MAEAYVNRYVGDGTDNLAMLGAWDPVITVGDWVSAIGLASQDAVGHRIRVRNMAEIVRTTLRLLPSWNVISVPFPTPVSLLPTCDLVLSWDGSLWQPASPTNLPPGLDFLLQASTPGTITLTRLP